MGRPDIYKLNVLEVGSKTSFTFLNYADMLKKKRCIFQNAVYHGIKIKTHILYVRDKSKATLEVTRVG